MSRKVIRDVVIPIVEKMMQQHRPYSHYRRPVILDLNLEEFLEEEMRRHFGVIGANECQHLREQLEEAKKNDPYAFEYLIRKLLDRYLKLAAKIRYARKTKKLKKGPPDRFSELWKRRHPSQHQ